MPKAEPDLDYRWVPGQGCDAVALENMRAHFRRPAEPMGEAWFMSDERKTFPKLMGDLAELKPPDIFEPLDELASGPSSFGQQDEWRVWLHYLLPRLTHIWHSHYHVFDSLVTAFISQYSRTPIDEPYKGFRRDTLLTIGRAIMDPICWPAGKLDIEVALGRDLDAGGYRGWHNTSQKLSASLFFCLKYLERDEVGSWLKSALSISDCYWRAQLVAWFVGAHGILTGEISQPAELAPEKPPGVSWWMSDGLTGNYSGSFAAPLKQDAFIPDENRDEAISTVRAFFDDATFLVWCASFSVDTGLETELGDLPFRFHELYVAS